jgi:hypothetical protein
MNNQEVMTFTDKAARNKAFKDLKTNGDYLEHQVVRFSGYEPTGEKKIRYEGVEGFELRPVYRSTWSIAYPRTGDLTGRAYRREIARQRVTDGA